MEPAETSGGGEAKIADTTCLVKSLVTGVLADNMGGKHNRQAIQ